MSGRAEIERAAIRFSDKWNEIRRLWRDIDLCAVEERGLSEEAFRYYHVKGFAKEEEPNGMIFRNLIIGMYTAKAPLSYLICSNGAGINVFVGTDDNHDKLLAGLLKGTLPHAALEKTENNKFKIVEYDDIIEKLNCRLGYEGLLRGVPVLERNDGIKYPGADAIADGMRGVPWVYSIFAVPLSEKQVWKELQFYNEEARLGKSLQRSSFSTHDNYESSSSEVFRYDIDEHISIIEKMRSDITASLNEGRWISTAYYMSDTRENAERLGGLLSTLLYSSESPDPVRFYQQNGRIYKKGVITNHVYADGESVGQLFSTKLTSGEVAAYTMLPLKDNLSFKRQEEVEYEEFREKTGELSLGRIISSGEVSPTDYSIDINELNRHCLIVGLTGSGKTNTLKSLLCTLKQAEPSMPFLILEPAKKEYWELYNLGFDDLQIFGAWGAEGILPLKINPFECPKGTLLHTHIDSLFAAFKASFIMYTPMPYVLESAIYEVYQDRGWSTELVGETDKNREFPTIEDLYHKIPEVVDKMGYDQRMRSDLIASLQARINSLRVGIKGEILNVSKSCPSNILFERPTVIELENIGDEEAKAFIISMLLIQLAEYRKSQSDMQKKVRHIMVIEEAHRLLKNVSAGTGDGADPRGNAVEFFCNMLAELRSKGQSFIIADQIPTKLATDVIKNTNLKIVHRTVAEDDRRVMGGAMNMNNEQIAGLAVLKQGNAAIFSEGDNRPKLVRAPFTGKYKNNTLGRRDVIEQIRQNNYMNLASMDYCCRTNFDRICLRCPRKCSKDSQGLDDYSLRIVAEQIAKKLNPKEMHTINTNKLRTEIRSAVPDASGDNSWKAYCVFREVLQIWGLSDNNTNRLINAMLCKK